MSRQEEAAIQQKSARSFEPGDIVLVSKFSGGGKWVKGVVMLAKGSVNYEVRLTDGRVVQRHLDQIVRYHSVEPEISRQSSGLDDAAVQLHDDFSLPSSDLSAGFQLPVVQPVVEPRQPEMLPAAATSAILPVVPETTSEPTTAVKRSKPVPERRAPSERVRKKPAYLEEYAT